MSSESDFPFDKDTVNRIVESWERAHACATAMRGVKNPSTFMSAVDKVIRSALIPSVVNSGGDEDGLAALYELEKERGEECCKECLGLGTVNKNGSDYRCTHCTAYERIAGERATEEATAKLLHAIDELMPHMSFLLLPGFEIPSESRIVVTKEKVLEVLHQVNLARNAFGPAT